jgi:hypothetical protein
MGSARSDVEHADTRVLVRRHKQVSQCAELPDVGARAARLNHAATVHGRQRARAHVPPLRRREASERCTAQMAFNESASGFQRGPCCKWSSSIAALQPACNTRKHLVLFCTHGTPHWMTQMDINKTMFHYKKHEDTLWLPHSRPSSMDPTLARGGTTNGALLPCPVRLEVCAPPLRRC